MTNPTFRQKIAQLFILGFSGDTISSEHPISQDISQRKLGGVILFDRLLAHDKSSNNIINSAQLRQLTQSLQELSDTDLLVCVDQEGGRVCRFSKERGFPTTPAAQDLGETDDLTATQLYGRQTAEMLREVGVNFNLAPVVDLNIYPENPIIGKYGRSFSEHAHTVATQARTWISQHRQAKILTCLKHFPGHGSSLSDSHLGFVDVTDTWQENELLPFEQLIDQKMADSVMIGHLFNRNFDSNYPATLSKSTIYNQLCQKLNYNGPVISDDMQMKAITDHYGLAEACCLAINAGVDIIIIGNNLDHKPFILQHLIDSVEKCVEQGTIEESRIEEAYKKTLTLKQQL